MQELKCEGRIEWLVEVLTKCQMSDGWGEITDWGVERRSKSEVRKLLRPVGGWKIEELSKSEMCERRWK